MQKPRRFIQPDPPVLLCVSDHLGYLNTVRRSLGRAGFTVITTRSPTQAVDLAVGSHIDVVLCDYDLSQMDGIALLGQIRDACEENLPPTLITAENYAPSLLAQVLAAGAAGMHVRSEPAEVLVDRVISVIEDEAKRIYAEQMSSRRQVQGGTDFATGLASKTHFARRLSGESVASYRDKNHISVLMLDVDRYDRICESYGNDRAEDVLVQAARLIEGELRSRDCVARYEDHTFAIILPATQVNAGEAVGGRLRRILTTTEFGDLDEPISITVSVGVSTRPPGALLSPEEMITQALRAGNAASSMGGNRVVADTTLTGKPLVLLIGSTEGLTPADPSELENIPVEIRSAQTFEEAKDIALALPVAMAVAPENPAAGEYGVEFLAWLRDHSPTVRRVLVTGQISIELMTNAVNKAGINYFIGERLESGELVEIIDTLLFS